MYCKNCGKIIADDSSFCSHCGELQKHPQVTTQTQQILGQQSAKKHEGIFGLNITKQVVGYYMGWLLIQLILLIGNWGSSFYMKERFWPFSKNSELADYDFGEFLLYTLVPLFLLVIVNIFKTPKEKKNEILQSKYDLTHEKDAAATFIGITLITLSVILYFAFLKGNDFNIYDQTEQIIKITIYAISLIIRLGIIFWVVQIAKELNRDVFVWGCIAFFFPSITLIVIGQKRKLKTQQK